MRIKKQPTKMVRVRIKDIHEARDLSRRLQKKGPDFWAELIRNYKRWHQ